jgi:hypothetical protein
MRNELEEFLRKHCNLIDWHPSAQQLDSIQRDIDESLRLGKKLSRTDCQNIVMKHCGATQMFLTKGLDNSDLNTMLAMALATVNKEK